MNHSKNEKTEDEAKEEGQVAEEGGITISHKSSRNVRPSKRLHRYISQQPQAKSTRTANITTYITKNYKNATDSWCTKLKHILRIAEGKDEKLPIPLKTARQSTKKTEQSLNITPIAQIPPEKGLRGGKWQQMLNSDQGWIPSAAP